MREHRYPSRGLCSRILFALLALTAFVELASAQTLRERWLERRNARVAQDSDIQLPDGVRLLRNIAYGNDPLQRMDIYLPAKPDHAPVLFMVHGGGWRLGDKAHRPVVENKVKHWVTTGFIFVSVNYRMLPDTGPLEQSRDVAKALAFAQTKAADWGGDADRFILMGHSAGAHLVALLSAAPDAAYALGAKPWLGTVALDSAAYDVARIMQSRHPRLYDDAFGNEPAQWTALSPIAVLSDEARPLLAICSSQRRDSCPQARAYMTKANARKLSASVQPEDLSHAEINAQLGLAGPYTRAVDDFIASLLAKPTDH